jgi:hypothetical protein
MHFAAGHILNVKPLYGRMLLGKRITIALTQNLQEVGLKWLYKATTE